jgi:hypothetical protein
LGPGAEVVEPESLLAGELFMSGGITPHGGITRFAAHRAN